MASYDFNLRLVSPAFIAGADKTQPEMRAPTLRGQLRYWYRAVYGAAVSDTAKLYAQEASVFGSTTEGSKFNLLVLPRKEETVKKIAMLPHKSMAKERSETHALTDGQLYDLSLFSRPNQDVDNAVFHSLAVWSLLGGLGRRSRRMFGGVRVTAKKNSQAAQGKWYAAIETPEDLAARIGDLLTKQVNSKGEWENAVPTFPTLHPRHAWVMVGKRRYDHHETLVIDLFRELLRKDKIRKKESSFGYVRPSRRASTLHAQMRFLGGGYYPVLTVLRSKPDGGIDWQHLNNFMVDAHEFFDGVTAWGDALK